MNIEEVGLDGPEVGVEAVVLSPDEVRTVAVTRKTLCQDRSQAAVGYSIDAHDELLKTTHSPASSPRQRPRSGSPSASCTPMCG